MLAKLPKLLAAGFLVFAIWHTESPAQEEAWERHYRAGEAAYRQRNYQEAVEQNRAALKAAERFGPEDPRLANTLIGLGASLQAQRKYAEAEPLFERAVAIHEKALGPDHLAVARSRGES